MDWNASLWTNTASIKDIEIHYNSIYAIISSKEGTFVGIASKSTGEVEFRDRITDEVKFMDF